MKSGIHPKFFEATVECSCGAVFKVGSTLKNLSVDICAQCHPFYTGEFKILDTEGRVERFKNKFKSYSSSDIISSMQKVKKKKQISTEEKRKKVLSNEIMHGTVTSKVKKSKKK